MKSLTNLSDSLCMYQLACLALESNSRLCFLLIWSTFLFSPSLFRKCKEFITLSRLQAYHSFHIILFSSNICNPLMQIFVLAILLVDDVLLSYINKISFDIHVNWLHMIFFQFLFHFDIFLTGPRVSLQT